MQLNPKRKRRMQRKPRVTKKTMTVTNITDVRQGMKIKSSDNKLFKVHPVFSNVDPGKSVDVTVKREAARCEIGQDSYCYML
ncbi:MSP domain protein, partial [Ostertagia ostertagi]